MFGLNRPSGELLANDGPPEPPPTSGMDQDELKSRVDAVVATGENDDEHGHCMEDTLLQDIIEAFCPGWVVAEVDRMNRADFCRWYA